MKKVKKIWVREGFKQEKAEQKLVREIEREIES